MREVTTQQQNMSKLSKKGANPKISYNNNKKMKQISSSVQKKQYIQQNKKHHLIIFFSLKFLILNLNKYNKCVCVNQRERERKKTQ